MTSHQESGRLLKCDDFHALSPFYSRLRLYSLAVHDRHNEVVVSLAPTNWSRAWMQSLCLAILCFAFLGLALVLKPQPLNYSRVLGGVVGVSLFPFYWPFLWLLMLRKRLPLIRFDKKTRVVHLLGESRQAPISEVMAICDVIVQREERFDGNSVDSYELQLLLKRQSGRESLLLSGAWHPSAEKAFGPIASNIASSLGIAHLSVNTVHGTVVEQSAGKGPDEEART